MIVSLHSIHFSHRTTLDIWVSKSKMIIFDLHFSIDRNKIKKLRFFSITATVLIFILFTSSDSLFIKTEVMVSFFFPTNYLKVGSKATEVS